MKRFRYRPLTALLTFGAICGIGTSVGGGNEAYAADTPDVGLSQQALDIGDLAAMCGYVCPGGKDGSGNVIKTIAEGNASVSGIASVDAFFASVVNYQLVAKGVAGGINAELEGIRADFNLEPGDIGAKLKAKLAANLEGGVRLKIEPAQCKADIKAELAAAAKCDAEVQPGMLSVQCMGGCDVEAKAQVSCDASAELRCTVVQPEVKCMGSCSGKCRLDLSASAAAACNGTCTGMCMGTCSAYSDKEGTKCAGTCSGTCMGSCDVDVTADADLNCMGQCQGECTVTREPSAGCEGGVRAQCRAKGSAAIKCDTKCDGAFEPPKVKAECEARVHADAKLNVQCTPPRAVLDYKLNASLSVEERARFEYALKSLINARLPALKAAVARSKLAVEAGASLGALGADAIGKINVSGNARAAFGLTCAVDQVKLVPGILKSATDSLNASITAAADVDAAFKN
jgi:hypothetical protein